MPESMNRVQSVASNIYRLAGFRTTFLECLYNCLCQEEVELGHCGLWSVWRGKSEFTCNKLLGHLNIIVIPLRLMHNLLSITCGTQNNLTVSHPSNPHLFKIHSQSMEFSLFVYN